MTGIRNVEARIIKLESRRERADEFLAVWRTAGSDVSTSVPSVKVAQGSRVVSLEWSGRDPLPAPKWHHNSRPDFSPEEEGCVTHMLTRTLAGSQASAEDRSPLLGGMTDGELLHRAFGVAL
ncbi:hypothetical protein ACVWWO_005635 [Bradyrhizobium sp. F1.13.1]